MEDGPGARDRQLPTLTLMLTLLCLRPRPPLRTAGDLRMTIFSPVRGVPNPASASESLLKARTRR